MTPVSVTASRDVLGECPVWSIAEQALYWVDILGQKLRRYDYAAGTLKSWALPQITGSFALCKNGNLLLAMQTGFAFFDPLDGSCKPAIEFPAADPVMRFNDGRCDRRGRFWVGSMHMHDISPTPHGALYRVDPIHGCRLMQTGICAPNSLAWSPDNSTMYFADTRLRTIFAYPFDIDRGELGERHVFVTADVMPDGATVDQEGYLWSAAWGGSRLTRYAPDGTVDRVLDLPVRRPTSCAFGGPNLATLFVTSAMHRETPEQLARQPLSGALLAIDVGVRGLPEPLFSS